MLIVFKANHQSLPFIEVKSICILTIFVQDKREDTGKKDIYSKAASKCDKFDKSITQNSFFKYNNLFCFGQEFNRA